MIAKGKKTRAWDKVRAELVQEFKRSGITYCELRMAGCSGGSALSFAHAVKRRHLSDDAELGSPSHIKTVALICIPCHQKIEVLREAEMQEIVMRLIEQRGLTSE